MEETVFTVDVSKAARLQRALKWASGTKQVSHCMLPVVSMNRWAHTGHDWGEHSWPWRTGRVPWHNLSEKAMQAYPKLESLSLHLSLPAGTRLGRAVAWWLKHSATNRQVAVSIPDGVIGIFEWHNPFGRTMALGSTQPLTEMSTGCIVGVKAAGA
jgi:hypothetical protein